MAQRKTAPTVVEKKPRTRPTAKTNPTTGGFHVSDELWALLAPLLPPQSNTHRFGGGRPRVPDRQCADGIFFVLRTGCQWKALDQTQICSGSTAHARFQQWVAAGVFRRLWEVALGLYDELKGLDWEWLSMDGAQTKAPLGGEKKRAQSHGSGETRGEAEHVDRSCGHPGRRGGGRS